LAGVDGWWMAGRWRAENAGSQRLWGRFSQGKYLSTGVRGGGNGPMVDFAGGEPRIKNPLCRRRTWPPLRHGNYRRNEVLQAKMSPLGHFIGEERFCRRRRSPLSDLDFGILSVESGQVFNPRSEVLQAKIQSFLISRPHISYASAV